MKTDINITPPREQDVRFLSQTVKPSGAELLENIHPEITFAPGFYIESLRVQILNSFLDTIQWTVIGKGDTAV